MIITTWNKRGLSGNMKQRYLKEILRKDKPRVIILQEENISELKLKENIGNCRPRYELVGQDPMGSAGGLAILWNLEEVCFKDWKSMPRILFGKFRNIGFKEWILLLGVYGPHIQRERKIFISNPTKVSGLYQNISWIIGGDFNMIKSLNEK